MDNKKYFLDIPYPKLEINEKNPEFASRLSQDLAGTVSELTAITKYLYQHFISCNEELSLAMKSVARVEMTHMDIIGEMIVDFGGNPIFAVPNGRNKFFWGAQYIYYNREPRCFLKENICGEEKAIWNYRCRIKETKNTSAIAMLERIILDEEHHIKIFKELLEKACKNK